MANTGYIYKLCCNDVTVTDIYIGSTKNHYRRKNVHKTSCNKLNGSHYNLYVYRFIRENGGWDNWSFIILDTVQYNQKHELHLKEREYIETLGATLNRNIPTRTQRQWKQEHKEEISEYQKQYYEDNRVRIAERAKQYAQLNKQAKAEYLKQYNQNNRERISEQRSQKIECECGKKVSRRNIRQHQRSKRHHETFSRKIYDFIWS